MAKFDTSEIDKIIVGRIEPHIYAFTTQTIPNYLKVGDTGRPVSRRLEEWRSHFPDLKKEYERSSLLENDIFFRDYSVHYYLENVLNKHRLQPSELPNKSIYYSNEFFFETTPDDIDLAIKDISKKENNAYQYYSAKSLTPITEYKRSDKEWSPRPNQKEVIENFKKAVGNGRTNLLMYAVMRFGKTFTSLCCANEKCWESSTRKANTILIVSGKADVKEEWKRTIQIPKNFEDINFIDHDSLKRSANFKEDYLDKGKRVAIFLTLQDLQGDKKKDIHKEIFETDFDLLIIDETHFGVRAQEYGKVLKRGLDDDEESYSSLKEAEKLLKRKLTIHLSGTPYRILMSSEFSEDDIIAFVQSTDIIDAQNEWDNEHFGDIASKEINHETDLPYEEWDNPYFGYPQMIRFAFNPNESTRKKLRELKDSGLTGSFSELFKPKSIKKDSDGDYKKFEHEKEILDMMKVIDGDLDDDELFGFLNYKKINDGKMCRHMVFVLPYCASCDAMEELLTTHKNDFKNHLGEYQVINISGVGEKNNYKSIDSIRNAIRIAESKGQKTITLTVNRALTGCTIPEWDTMLFLKETKSPQEYDQAIFRLQNQYIKEYTDKDGHVMKENMKPQTLLIDFIPNRMFEIQEQKTLIYNVNTSQQGNDNLNERLEKELSISPIFYANKNKMEKVEPSRIIDEVRKYSSERGVYAETMELPVDTSLENNELIRSTIMKQADIGSKNGGISVPGTSGNGEGEDLDIPNQSDESDADGEKTDITSTNNDSSNKDDGLSFEKKFKTYYSRILFFAFLTNDETKSLKQIIEKSDSNDNSRILKNLGLAVNVLKEINSKINPFVLNQLDFKIQNLNDLSRDSSLTGPERAENASKKFDRLSSSEVVTPNNICNIMVNSLSDDFLKDVISKKGKILDVASKKGEFALSLYKKFVELGYKADQFKYAIYSIPTSSVAYEFTRKIYEYLGLNIDNIAAQFTAYDLIKFDNIDGTIDELKRYLSQEKTFSEIELTDNLFYKEGKEMKFDAIVGNPPYNEADGGAGASSSPIYPYFVNIAREFNPDLISMIIPTRWFTGGKGKDLKEFRESMLNDTHIKQLDDYLHPEEIFPSTNNRGGICYFIWDKHYDNKLNNVKVVTHNEMKGTFETIRPMKIRDLNVFIRNFNTVSLLNKVIPEGTNDTMSKHVSSRNPFDIESNIIKTDEWHNEKTDLKNPVPCYGKHMKLGYVDRSIIKKGINLINDWKVFLPRANNIGTELNDDNLNAFLGNPGTICTEAYLVAGINLDLSEEKAKNLANYFKTKFVRFMHSLAKASHDATRETYRFVPVVDFSETWTDRKLYEKFKLNNEEIELIEQSIKPMK